MTSKEYYDKYMRKPDEGICPVCKTETPWQSFDRGYLKHCSNKCTQNDPKVIKKREAHFMQKYGVKNPYQAEEVKNKIIKHNLETYSVAYNLQRPEIRQQIKQTNLEKYGDENPTRFGSEIFKQSMLDIYGVDAYCKVDNFSQCLVRPNVEGYYKVQDILTKYGTGWYQAKLFPLVHMHGASYLEEKYVNILDIITKQTTNSVAENYLLYLISVYYNGNIINNTRTIIKPLELDIYLPDIKIAFEYNGIHWHSIKSNKNSNYHYNKSKLCFDKDIRLIHIYEFENWTFIEDFIKSIFAGTEIPTNDFNKYSPLQFEYSVVEFSGPQLLESNIYRSGTFNLK